VTAKPEPGPKADNFSAQTCLFRLFSRNIRDKRARNWPRWVAASLALATLTAATARASATDAGAGDNAAVDSDAGRAPAAPAPAAGVARAPGLVVFDSPALTRPSVEVDGPSWTIRAPRLPASSPDGAQILVAESEITTVSETPNLTLVVRRVRDGAAVASYPLLAVSEFVQPRFEASGNMAAGAAYEALAATVRRRIALAEAALEPTRWRSLGACRLQPGPYDPAGETASGRTSPFPCALREQRIDCGALVASYSSRALTGRWRGRPFRFDRRDFAPRPMRSADVGAIPVRACFAGAWLDPVRGILVGFLVNECQRGGDSCVVQPKWLPFRLP
jgi:hypothetical protein